MVGKEFALANMVSDFLVVKLGEIHSDTRIPNEPLILNLGTRMQLSMSLKTKLRRLRLEAHQSNLQPRVNLV
jgi:hypothetical protein